MNSAACLQLSKLSTETRASLKTELTRRITRHQSRRLLYSLFPDVGPLRRELYPKHLEFFARGGRHEPGIGCPENCDGSPHQERAFIAANRVGKTTAAGYEVSCHLIGWYPHWWVGRRFDHPVTVWACGEDAKAMRESIQPVLCGPPEAFGTGTVPGDEILGKTARSGVPDAIDSMTVRHKDGISRLVFKTYDQGRESYQGAKVHVLWDDEEPPPPIYTEGLTRTMSTVPGEPNGIVLCTFTPLKGTSEIVKGFMPSGKLPDVQNGDYGGVGLGPASI